MPQRPELTPAQRWPSRCGGQARNGATQETWPVLLAWGQLALKGPSSQGGDHMSSYLFMLGFQVL